MNIGTGLCLFFIFLLSIFCIVLKYKIDILRIDINYANKKANNAMDSLSKKREIDLEYIKSIDDLNQHRFNKAIQFIEEEVLGRRDKNKNINTDIETDIKKLN